MRLLACLVLLGAACGPVAAPSGARAQAGSVGADARAIWEQFRGSWSQTKGAVKEQWGRLTDDDLLEIEGRRDQLVGKIQVRYGISREDAEAQVGAWEKTRPRGM